MPRFMANVRSRARPRAPAPQRNKRGVRKQKQPRIKKLKTDRSYYYERDKPMGLTADDILGDNGLGYPYTHRLQFEWSEDEYVRARSTKSKACYTPNPLWDGARPMKVELPPKDKPRWMVLIDAEDLDLRELDRDSEARRQKPEESVQEVTGALDAVELEDAPAARVPIPLMELPVLAQELILKELLVVDKPIMVMSGWTKILKLRHRRGKPEEHAQQPQIFINILSACKYFCQMGQRVLYGGNVFLYRLRDPTNEVVNVEEINTDDDVSTSQDEDDGAVAQDIDMNDPEYVPGMEHLLNAVANTRNRTRRSAKTLRKQAEKQIDITKFRHLMRDITVEAEHNRSDALRMKSMARALETFLPNATRAGDHRANVRRLTIRVSPEPIIDLETRKMDVTFFDFFNQGSVLMEAIEQMECQYLQVELRSEFLIKEGLPNSGGRFTLDLRHCRIQQLREAGIKDYKICDKAMEGATRDEAEFMRNEQRNLRGHINKYWKSCHDADEPYESDDLDPGLVDVQMVDYWGATFTDEENGEEDEDDQMEIDEIDEIDENDALLDSVEETHGTGKPKSDLPWGWEMVDDLDARES